MHFSLLIYLATVPWLADHPLVAIPFAFVLANGVALLYWYLIERHYPTVRRAIRRSGVWPSDAGPRPTSAPGGMEPGGDPTSQIATRRSEDHPRNQG